VVVAVVSVVIILVLLALLLSALNPPTAIYAEPIPISVGPWDTYYLPVIPPQAMLFAAMLGLAVITSGAVAFEAAAAWRTIDPQDPYREIYGCRRIAREMNKLNYACSVGKVRENHADPGPGNRSTTGFQGHDGSGRK
jgi:hypothetical protein